MLLRVLAQTSRHTSFRNVFLLHHLHSWLFSRWSVSVGAVCRRKLRRHHWYSDSSVATGWKLKCFYVATRDFLLIVPGSYYTRQRSHQNFYYKTARNTNSIKAKIYYTGFPVASLQQVGNFPVYEYGEAIYGETCLIDFGHNWTELNLSEINYINETWTVNFTSSVPSWIVGNCLYAQSHVSSILGQMGRPYFSDRHFNSRLRIFGKKQ